MPAKKRRKPICIPGSELRELRMLAGLTQIELAERLGSGYGPDWVKSKEQSKNAITDAEWLHIISVFDAIFAEKQRIGQDILRLKSAFRGLKEGA